MGKFTKVSENTFKEIQLEAGLILNTFDPSGTAEVADEHIVCATTGGIEIACKPTFTDYGEDIDNVPNNMLVCNFGIAIGVKSVQNQTRFKLNFLESVFGYLNEFTHRYPPQIVKYSAVIFI